MCIKKYLTALQAKHAAAEAQIQLLMIQTTRDEKLLKELKELKKIKLDCKTKIARLENPDRATAPKPKKPLSKTKQKKLARPTEPIHQPSPSEELASGQQKAA